MSDTTTEPDILTIKQVDEYLRVTERTIYRLAAARQIPLFKVGGAWRFSRTDLDDWIKQQSVRAPRAGEPTTNKRESRQCSD